MPRLLLFLLLLAPLGCTPETPTPDVDTAALDAVYGAFRQAYLDNDTEAMRRIYTDDCRYLPGSSEVGVQPCDVAISGFDGMFRRAETDTTRLDISFRIVERVVGPGVAADVGFYKLMAIPNGATTGRPGYGKFVVVFRQDASGAWRMHVDGFSGAPAAAYEEATSLVFQTPGG